MRYYLAVRDSDIFATRNMFRVANVVESTLHINPHAAQFAAYRAAGISLAIRQISQIREDLYRFSLSALSDKLNFPRGSRLQKYILIVLFYITKQFNNSIVHKYSTFHNSSCIYRFLTFFKNLLNCCLLSVFPLIMHFQIKVIQIR